jgi:HNH endonuclease
MKERKTIPPKTRLAVLKRDNFTCQSCGKSPATYPELEIDACVKLEIDHFQPHSKGGSINLDNLQTLCLLCNRGKGNNEDLNLTVRNKIEILLNKINPAILKNFESVDIVRVVANDSDYSELVRLNNLVANLDIQVLPNTIFGYQAMFNFGIYTIDDNHAGKVNFTLKFIN